MESGISVLRTEDYLRLLEIEKQYFTIKNDCSVFVVIESGNRWSTPNTFTAMSFNEGIKAIREAQEKSYETHKKELDKTWKNYLECKNQSIWSFIKSKFKG